MGDRGGITGLYACQTDTASISGPLSCGSSALGAGQTAAKHIPTAILSSQALSGDPTPQPVRTAGAEPWGLCGSPTRARRKGSYCLCSNYLALLYLQPPHLLQRQDCGDHSHTQVTVPPRCLKSSQMSRFKPSLDCSPQELPAPPRLPWGNSSGPRSTGLPPSHTQEPSPILKDHPTPSPSPPDHRGPGKTVCVFKKRVEETRGTWESLEGDNSCCALCTVYYSSTDPSFRERRRQGHLPAKKPPCKAGWRPSGGRARYHEKTHAGSGPREERDARWTHEVRPRRGVCREVKGRQICRAVRVGF